MKKSKSETIAWLKGLTRQLENESRQAKTTEESIGYKFAGYQTQKLLNIYDKVASD
jgi:hypothetical protein